MKMGTAWLCFIFFYLSPLLLVQSFNLNPQKCPADLDEKSFQVFNGLQPAFGSVKNIIRHDKVHSLEQCAYKCCAKMDECDLAHFVENSCLNYRCKTLNHCNLNNMDKNGGNNSYIIFVRRKFNGTDSIAISDQTSAISLTKDASSQITHYKVPISTQQTETKTPPTITKLQVILDDNPVLRLPTNSIEIRANVLPLSQIGYKYEWKLISYPQMPNDGIGYMQYQNTPKLKLSNLKVGVYSFNLTVSGPNALGSALVNITVLPPKRINQPPEVIIQPNNTVVKLPTKETVLDASFSQDDDKIMSFKWEPIQVPIGYQIDPQSDLNTATLQLKNLIAGLYLFKLTITDSDNATATGSANVTVLKEIDYPPTAVAGADIIIYLPQNEVTLNGNASTDDKGITSWLWTRAQDEDDRMKSKSVDMDGTTTPYLHLSKLDVGVYKFILKVTDTSNQTSTAETHVFVKHEIDTKPNAVAGPNLELSMPLQSDLTLDGSASSDRSLTGIVSWNWTQIAGPRAANILQPTQAITNVTGLIPGIYTFNLTVLNAKNFSDWATVNVSVTQLRNIPPVANAGGNQTIICGKCDLITLNGSRSYDDIQIASYTWNREATSLAAGDILNNSDSKPILQLTNLVQGEYLFKLTVTDSQGAVGVDVVSLIIKNDYAQEKNEVEMLLNADVRHFSSEQQYSLLKRLEFFLANSDGKPANITLHKLHYVFYDKRVLLVFTVRLANQQLPALEVVRRLREKLRTDSTLIVPRVISVNPVICQSSCSGHGDCDQYSKRCVCNTFWMENFIRVRYGDQESNCDWSILYVTIISFIIMISLCSVFWCLLCLLFGGRGSIELKSKAARLKRRISVKKGKNRKSHKYTLLDNDGDRERESSDDDKQKIVIGMNSVKRKCVKSDRTGRSNGDAWRVSIDPVINSPKSSDESDVIFDSNRRTINRRTSNSTLRLLDVET